MKRSYGGTKAFFIGCTLALSGCGDGEGPPGATLEREEASLSQVVPFTTHSAIVTSGSSHDSIPLLAYGPNGTRVAAFHYNGTKTVGDKTLPTFGRHGTGGNLALVKFASNDSVAWAKGFSPGNPTEDLYLTPHALTVDALGNIIVTGQLSQPASLGGATLQAGYFLAKFAPNGDHLYSRNTRAAPGTIMQIVNLKTAPNGDVYALADYYKSNKVRPMVVRYDGATLEERWTKILGTEGQFSISRHLAVDGVNRPYLTGHFGGTLTLGNTTMSADPRGSGFLVAMNQDGSYRWAQRLGVWGDAGDLSTRDGHLVVAASGEPVTSEPEGGYVVSYDLSGRLKFWIRTGAQGPWSVRLGTSKEIAVLSPDDAWLSRPGGSNEPFYLTLYDRVSATQVERRSLLDSRPVWDPGQLEIDPQTGSVSLGAIGAGEVSFGGTPEGLPIDGDAFFLEYRH